MSGETKKRGNKTAQPVKQQLVSEEVKQLFNEQGYTLDTSVSKKLGITYTPIDLFEVMQYQDNTYIGCKCSEVRNGRQAVLSAKQLCQFTDHRNEPGWQWEADYSAEDAFVVESKSDEDKMEEIAEAVNGSVVTLIGKVKVGDRWYYAFAVEDAE